MPVDSPTPDVEKFALIAAESIAPRLLAHYDRHARALPWRVGPAERQAGVQPDPYRVWLSEIMLQQTTVATVKGYFERFMARWPTVAALAAADEADVLAAWAGLGYYARARNLIRCARVVAGEHGGAFPDTESGLAQLPGIGRYTAAAVAAIAFDQRAAVVDANVERVVARLFALEQPLPAIKPAIHRLVEAMTPAERPGDFAQAMMDLGATLCSVRAPACTLCPLQPHCRAALGGDPARLPVKPVRKEKPKRHGAAFWIERNGAVWLVRRPGRGMLGGMRALPDDGWFARSDGSGVSPLDGPWIWLENPVSHVFSHFSLELRLALYAGGNFDKVPPGGEWWPVESLAEAGLPTLFAKAATLARAERHRIGAGPAGRATHLNNGS